jgi:hypothetical protein
MTPDDLTGLTNVLLTAGAAGAVLAFAYLARQRMMRSDRTRLWVGAALVAVPGLLLGWAVTRPELGVTAAYGEFTEAILGTTPVVDARPAPRPPVARRTPASGVEEATSDRSSDGPTSAPVVGGDTESPAPPGTTPPPPSATPSVTPTPTPSPSPSVTPTPTPSPSPSGTPSPTPTPSPSPGADDDEGSPRDEIPPPPPPEPDGS